jgi:hypothetical protein
MNKNNAKKLTLSKETLRRLNETELLRAAGGAWSDESVCPTTSPSEKRFCA